MVVSCTTPSPHHLTDMTDLYNTILPCQTNKEQTHNNYIAIMVVSCTTPSPPHLTDMPDLYNTILPCQTKREQTPKATTE